MEPIKIEVTVNVNVDMPQGTKDFVSAIVERKIEAAKENAEKSSSPLLSVLSVLAQGCNTPTHVSPIELPKSLAPAEEKAVEEKAVEEKAVEKKKPSPEPSKKESKSEKTVGIEDVRAILTTKVNDHRGVIRDKLTSLGAKSVTTLDPEKYQEMYDFLMSL